MQHEAHHSPWARQSADYYQQQYQLPTHRALLIRLKPINPWPLSPKPDFYVLLQLPYYNPTPPPHYVGIEAVHQNTPESPQTHQPQGLHSPKQLLVLTRPLEFVDDKTWT